MSNKSFRPREKHGRCSVLGLLGGTKTKALLTPRAFVEQHLSACSGEEPSLAALAAILRQHGYATPRGNTYCWPAQVRELLAGRFDAHYSASELGAGVSLG